MPFIIYAKVSIALIFCFVFFLAGYVEGITLVGVVEGDWIEYMVSTTGTPPKEFDVTWAKMEIISVGGTVVHANVTTRFTNGSLASRIMTFDLEKGKVGAWFIIPAGLGVGDCFRDSSLGRNITVEGEERLTFAGAMRTVTNATTPQRLKRWDKATGVFVECIDALDNYSINATAVRTNMWSYKELDVRLSTIDTILVVGVLGVLGCLVLSIAIKIKGRYRLQ